jgi:hypothetical protein
VKFRQAVAETGPFGRRCLSILPCSPFPLPAHQTGRADFPHPAFRSGFDAPRQNLRVTSRRGWLYRTLCAIWILCCAHCSFGQKTGVSLPPIGPMRQLEDYGFLVIVVRVHTDEPPRRPLTGHSPSHFGATAAGSRFPAGCSESRCGSNSVTPDATGRGRPAL